MGNINNDGKNEDPTYLEDLKRRKAELEDLQDSLSKDHRDYTAVIHELDNVKVAIHNNQ